MAPLIWPPANSCAIALYDGQLQFITSYVVPHVHNQHAILVFTSDELLHVGWLDKLEI